MAAMVAFVLALLVWWFYVLVPDEAPGVAVSAFCLALVLTFVGFCLLFRPTPDRGRQTNALATIAAATAAVDANATEAALATLEAQAAKAATAAGATE